MGLGKRIRTLRERAGLTQEELAQRLGVTPSAVGNYERDISHPKEEVLYRLFTALSCEPNELFSDYYNIKLSPAQLHMMKYRELDEHGRELVDACTEIEHRRCQDGLTMVAARSFGRDACSADRQKRLRLKKRQGAGSILDQPDYREDK